MSILQTKLESEREPSGRQRREQMKSAAAHLTGTSCTAEGLKGSIQVNWREPKVCLDADGGMIPHPFQVPQSGSIIVMMTGLFNLHRVSKMPLTAIVHMSRSPMRHVSPGYQYAYLSAATRCKGRALPHSMAIC